MKRVLSWLMIFMMMATMVPAIAFADDAIDAEDMAGGEAVCEHVWSEWVKDEAQEADCTTDGLQSRTCANCGAVETETVPAPGHVWENWEAQDVCTKDHWEYRYCQVCEDRDREYVEGKAHTWSKWYLQKRATSKAAGGMDRACTVCWIEEWKAIPKIATQTLSKAKFGYDGKVHIPTVTVKDSKGKKLVKGTDYTVSVKNSSGKVVNKPKNVGTYKVVITYKGNYKGTTVKTYKINPGATKITSLKKGNQAFTVRWTKKSNVTGYQIMYSDTKNPYYGNSWTAKIKKAGTTSKTISKLGGQETYWVKVRTYKVVSGKTYYSEWSASKKVKTTGKLNPYVFLMPGKIYHKDYMCPKFQTMDIGWVRESVAKAKGYKACSACK